MQEYLNPPDSGKMEKKVGDTIFREGDKVMQIKNDYQLEWEKKNRYGIAVEQGSGVFNGDTGIIDDINNYNQSVTVKFEDIGHAGGNNISFTPAAILLYIMSYLFNIFYFLYPLI